MKNLIAGQKNWRWKTPSSFFAAAKVNTISKKVNRFFFFVRRALH